MDEDGGRISNPDVRDRLAELAIPPAWSDVWICPDPLGHLQATGVDEAGRKQYLYHTRWREHRDRQKFEKMLRFAAALPKLRWRIASDLANGDELSHERAGAQGVAAAVRAVAELLGNTPAVARRAYIAPRVLDRYQSGWTIGAALDRVPELDPADDSVRAKVEDAVLDLLADRQESSALEQLDQAA